MKKMWLVVLLAGVLAVLWWSSLFAQWEPDVWVSSQVSDKCLSNAWGIACNGQEVYAVWSAPGPFSKPYGSLYFKKSNDGGQTWGPETSIPPGGNVTYQPAVAVSGSVVHVVWLDDRNQINYNPDVYYTCSLDGGANWATETPIISNGNAKYQPSIAALGTDVHVVWTEIQYNGSTGEEVHYKESTNNGSNWGSVTPLSPSDVNRHMSPSVAAAGDHVYVAWTDTRVGGYEVYYKIATDRGRAWESGDHRLIDPPAVSYDPVIAAEGPRVHLAYWKDPLPGDPPGQIYYRRSNDYGSTWQPDTHMSTVGAPHAVFYPSLAVSWPRIHVAWVDNRDGPQWSSDIYYDRSLDGGVTWEAETRLTTPGQKFSYYPSLAVSGPVVHLTIEDNRATDYHIYYLRYPNGNETFPCLRTENSQGRHFVRDPNLNVLHLVMTKNAGANDTVYYTRSSDNGFTWVAPIALGAGLYPTVGLAKNTLGGTVICVAYKPPTGNYLVYEWYDPAVGYWQSANISTSANPGPPSLAVAWPGAGTQEVFVAYASGSPTRNLKCFHLRYSTPSSVTTETIDAIANPAQPCLAVDGNGSVYGAWQRPDSNQVWYAPRGSKNYWSSKLRVDNTTDPSQQPFVDCYGDSVFVAWSDGQPSPSDVWRRSKRLTDLGWYTYRNVSQSSNTSESPTQAWREFTTWSEGTTTPGMFDINYWRVNGQTGDISNNPTQWSYWPHSQMNYNQIIGRTELWSAWTESPNANQPPFRVLTNFTQFLSNPGAGPGAVDFGPYYGVLAGQDTPSVYCRKRDGVLRFSGKAVDFARDSLVYELPYLDPTYDYYLKVSSYRETGNNWTQALSVNGGTARTVRFAPNRVDTAWVRIPPETYAQDRKVMFSLKKVQGDYVTSLGLTLYQRDPQRGGGGPQAGEPVAMPAREVFGIYPNPTNAQAQVEYSLNAPVKVKLAVYDVMGRLVRQVVNESQPAGVHKVTWDGKDANGKLAESGVYFMKLSSQGLNKTARFVVVR